MVSIAVDINLDQQNLQSRKVCGKLASFRNIRTSATGGRENLTMARIRNIGELDWNLNGHKTPHGGWGRNVDLSNRTMAVAYGVFSPAIQVRGCNKFALHLILTLDERFQNERDESCCFDESGFHSAHIWPTEDIADGIEIEESELRLPREIRFALSKLAVHYGVRFGEVDVFCSWDARKPLKIEIDQFKEEIRQPDRFLHALTHKLSRWVREAELTK